MKINEVNFGASPLTNHYCHSYNIYHPKHYRLSINTQRNDLDPQAVHKSRIQRCSLDLCSTLQRCGSRCIIISVKSIVSMVVISKGRMKMKSNVSLFQFITLYKRCVKWHRSKEANASRLFTVLKNHGIIKEKEE